MKRNVDDLAKRLVDSVLTDAAFAAPSGRSSASTVNLSSVGQAVSKLAGPHSYDPDEEEPDDQGTDDAGGGGGNKTSAIEFWMRAILDESGEFARISTFSDEGIMTENNGLVIVDKAGNKFQVTIVYAGKQ